MVTNYVLKNDIEKVLNHLFEFNHSDDAFVECLQSPCFKDALINYLDEFSITLDRNEIDVNEFPISIDCDGYPFIDADIEIIKMKISFKCRAYHHEGWDFYISNLSYKKNNYFKKELIKMLNERKNEDNKIELEVLSYLIEDYYTDKEYIFIEVKEGVLAIPYYNTCNNSICTPCNALEIDESFLIQDNIEKIQDIISQHKEIVNFLEDNLKSK